MIIGIMPRHTIGLHNDVIAPKRTKALTPRTYLNKSRFSPLYMKSF